MMFTSVMPQSLLVSFSLKVVGWTCVLWSLWKHVCASDAGQFAGRIRGQTGWNFADGHLEGSTDEPEGLGQLQGVPYLQEDIRRRYQENRR